MLGLLRRKKEQPSYDFDEVAFALKWYERAVENFKMCPESIILTAEFLYAGTHLIEMIKKARN